MPTSIAASTASLDSKCLYSAGPEIPHALPISPTETPWNPLAANSSAAVSRIWSRRVTGQVSGR